MEGTPRPRTAPRTTPDGEAAASVTLVLVDDHRLFTEGIEGALAGRSDCELVGVAPTASQARDLIADTSPQVVVLDQQLPDDEGVHLAAWIHAHHPHSKVVLVTQFGEDWLVRQALEAGCAGFLTKDRSIEDLCSAVLAVAAGEIAVPAEVLSRVLPQLTRHDGTTDPQLTSRETEILKLLAQGMSTEAIQEELALSASTVRNHTQNLLTKLGAHSKLEAVAIAARTGLVTMR